MLAKLLVLAVLAAAFVQLWLLAARRVTTARVRIEKVEKTFRRRINWRSMRGIWRIP